MGIAGVLWRQRRTSRVARGPIAPREPRQELSTWVSEPLGLRRAEYIPAIFLG